MISTQRSTDVFSTPTRRANESYLTANKRTVASNASAPTAASTSVKLSVSELVFTPPADIRVIAARCIVTLGQKRKVVETSQKTPSMGIGETLLKFDTTSNFDYFKLTSDLRRITIKVEVTGRSNTTHKSTYLDAIGMYAFQEGDEGRINIPVVSGHSNVGEVRLKVETQQEGYFDDSASEDGDYSATPSPMSPVRLRAAPASTSFAAYSSNSDNSASATSTITSSSTASSVSHLSNTSLSPILRHEFSTPVQLQWAETTMASAVKYSVQRDNTISGRKGSAPNTPRATAVSTTNNNSAIVSSDINSVIAAAAAAAATTSEVLSRDENRLQRSSTSVTVHSESASTSSTTTTISSGSVAEEQALEWHEKERLYQKELSVLRDAITQLEISRQEAISRLQMELSETREELLQTVNELNQSMNDSIHEYSTLGDVGEYEDIGKGSPGAAAAREEQLQQQSMLTSRLECEVSLLREQLAEEQQRWQEKEQQYLNEISVVKSQPPVVIIESAVSDETVANATEMPAPSSLSNLSFFVKSSLIIATALFVIARTR